MGEKVSDFVVGLKGRLPRPGWGILLILAALLIAVPRWVGTLQSVDATLLTGLGQGILLEGGAAYLILVWRKKQALKLARWLWLFFGLDLLVAPLILTPHTVAVVQGLALASLFAQSGQSWLLWAWSGLVNLAPVLLVSGVALAYALEHNTSQRESGQSQREGEGSQPPMRIEPVQPKALPAAGSYPCLVVGCAASFGSQEALNAHQRAHKPLAEAKAGR